MKRSVVTPILVATTLTGAGIATPLSANSVELATFTSVQRDNGVRPARTSSPLEQFKPRPDQQDHRIDYQYLDKALEWMVIPMGPSIREGAPTVQPNTGTRRIYGHTSRFRLEGNRVAFSFLRTDQRETLTEYRKDLERIGTELDLARLPRNEQLAYWMNLHNVAVIEALAYEYPLSDVRTRSFGSNQADLQNAKLVTVKGVELSPRDIREGIVYPNWSDPKVIYGFWRGEIGGPSIQRAAFTGDNISRLLDLSAVEFVNSLRAVEKYSGALRLSKVYEEAMPTLFKGEEALRSHLSRYARDDVKKLIAKTDKVRFKKAEYDVADLIRGTSDPGIWNYTAITDMVGGGGAYRTNAGGGGNPINPTSRIDPAIQRIITERNRKLNKAMKRGLLTGTVIVAEGEAFDPETGKVVE
jgi:hypothetical protein